MSLMGLHSFKCKVLSVFWIVDDVSQAQAAGSSHASPSRPSPSAIRPVGAPSPHAHMYLPQDSLAGVGGDVQEAFAQGETGLFFIRK